MYVNVGAVSVQIVSCESSCKKTVEFIEMFIHVFLSLSFNGEVPCRRQSISLAVCFHLHFVFVCACHEAVVHICACNVWKFLHIS